jgi:hypothetical protein
MSKGGLSGGSQMLLDRQIEHDAEIRRVALEEAAKVCESYPSLAPYELAKHIRALASQPAAQPPHDE